LAVLAGVEFARIGGWARVVEAELVGMNLGKVVFREGLSERASSWNAVGGERGLIAEAADSRSATSG
jgi:hypothetical protein